MTDSKISDMGAKTGSGGDFKVLDTKAYDFVVHGIIGLGLQENSFEGEIKDPIAKIKYVLELPSEIREDGQTQVVSHKVTLTAGARGNHFKMANLLAKVKEDDMHEYISSAGLKKLLGTTGTLTIKHWDKDGRTIASVDNKGFYPSHPSVPKPVAVRPPFFFNPYNPDMAVWSDILTFWTKKEIFGAVDAASFPDELKQAWIKDQEAENAKEADKAKGKAEAKPVSGANDTSSIE